jgi:hypothetical protein
MTIYGEIEMRRELPDGKVQRQAIYYATFGGSLDGFLSFNELVKTPYMAGAKDKNWVPGGPCLPFVPLPPELGDQWERSLVACDQGFFEPYLSDLKIPRQAVVDLLPDITPWVPFGVVSARAKEVLEDLFPDGSYFFPVRLYAPDGAAIARESCRWVPRHQFRYAKLKKPKGIPKMELPFSWSFVTSYPEHCAWEMTHRAEVRAILEPLPFWIFGLRFGRPTYNAATFAALKAEKLTGLVENTAEDSTERKSWENIGHIGVPDGNGKTEKNGRAA